MTKGPHPFAQPLPLRKERTMQNQNTCLSARDALVSMSVAYEGDWGKIHADIKALKPIEASNPAPAVDCVTILDEADYPKELLEVPQPPFVLYVKGNADLLHGSHDDVLSIAGSKSPTKYAAKYSAEIGTACAKRGLILCAKLSRGCARKALRACAEAGGKCIVVMSSGFDKPYPDDEENAKTIDAVIASGGVVVSEYPIGTLPKPQNFVASSRIVAALGKALFVPQADSHSGTMVVIAHALNAGRDVAALPFEAAEGDNIQNNLLIANGATLVYDADGFLEEEYHGVRDVGEAAA